MLDDEPRPLSLPRKPTAQRSQGTVFSDYTYTWERMLSDIEVVPFNNLSQAAGVLNVASSATSPVKRVLEVTARNTTLANSELLGKVGELGGKVADRVASRSRLGRLFNSITDQPDIPQVKLPEQVVDERFGPLNELTRVNEAGTVSLDPILNMLSQLYGQP